MNLNNSYVYVGLFLLKRSTISKFSNSPNYWFFVIAYSVSEFIAKLDAPEISYLNNWRKVTSGWHCNQKTWKAKEAISLLYF
jgi:hypothetical protein